MKNVPAEFLKDAIDGLIEIMDELRREKTSKKFPLQKFLRTLHTIKGSAQTFGLSDEARLTHEIESFFGAGQSEEDLLLSALEVLRKNFQHLLNGKTSQPLDSVIKELKKSHGGVKEGIGQNLLPDNFPAEISGVLGSAERDLLGAAWDNGKEILILEFGLAQENFGAKLRELRNDLDEAAEIVAVIPGGGVSAENTMLFRFLAAAENTSELIGLLRAFKGKVLFQKRKGFSALDNTLDEVAGEEIDYAILHGRKAAEILGKNVKFSVKKNSVKPPRELSGTVSTILLHLVRNAVDHGVEFPLERDVLQKPVRSNIEIGLKIENETFSINVCDDGRGIEDPDQIFNAGFSTAPFLSEFSGRGIGLDVVSDIVNKAGGTINIESKRGNGCKFEISLPPVKEK
jgi:chemotaxis protein histidine kinase CheA